MQFKKLTLALSAILLVIFSACSSNKDKVNAISIFSFKIDNVLYQSNATTAFITDTLYAGKKTLIIDGLTNNFRNHMELMITFPDTIGTGTFENMVEMAVMNIEPKENGYVDKTVTVNITSINNRHAEGTFSGVLINGEIEKPLTDGTFKVEILDHQ
ncbi:hypothetical protein DVR12_11940 [Chitinophaga silvatica]|uniref:Uncharacterized protein n=1 Tax=Chitinophaga silvatica TaxID=2282649 RepID=A0A3E1YA20_9BACT|nr:hypothetical protein [Chitinophaga silvatica]RFS22507.1 hypothetical protein DVR12_11940 [Chitinophaga silvatica]